ncbi:prolyl oligopeptidase family serine peptidase [Lutimonas halocynthiae]|uniref:prolyl oligopeptidase family serine peptidase n=1 Tax=Lutimonas halocynthiae TaxID=1446477 RepID=UPI0025B3C6FC|nr:prolyl oligopeptidase family serine peptidase [Lutimonas halocynthiae]MDN3643217.1 prolyl oligopeptidase family serine peptidase [Lutimonas halocynthiae]
MKRLSVLIFLMFFQVNLIIGQTSLNKIDLENGKHKVGFRHYIRSDSTRTYSRIYDYTNQTIARPIPVSIWYPSIQDTKGKEKLHVLDYLEILKEEEEWENLPNEQILNWFYYANTPANQNHLKEIANAYPKTEFAKGKFPVIIYTPSYQSSSIENFALCEYLASHGYIVIASPSRGTETRWFSNNNAKEMENQASDVAFLIKEVGKYEMANYDKIAVMGFSFGGLSNMIAQNKNERIKAIVSLDGTERYQYALLKKSPFFDINKMEVPYIHMSQKEIPDNVLEEDNIEAELNTKFDLYDSISYSTVYRLKFHHLTHSYFSTLGILFGDRDQRQDKSDAEIMESYKWVSTYTLNFLNAFLINDVSALCFVENNPSDNGVRNGLISQRTKQAESVAFSFQDFNDVASSQNYQNLFQLYDSIVKKHPSFKIPEGNLNTLGLQLVFNPSTSEQGINVFLLATKLYPNSANLFDSLAEGYLHIGNKSKAIENFEKSLELNAQNQNAIDRLKQLK